MLRAKLLQPDEKAAAPRALGAAKARDKRREKQRRMKAKAGPVRRRFRRAGPVFLCNRFQRQGNGVGFVQLIVAQIRAAEAGDTLEFCARGGVVVVANRDDAGGAVHRAANHGAVVGGHGLARVFAVQERGLILRQRDEAVVVRGRC